MHDTMRLTGDWPVGGGEMGVLIRAHGWAATPLGPIEAWPERLRAAVDACLASPLPSFVGWGEALTQIYNDAAATMIGAKHPDALGRPARESWADIWSAVGPLVEAAYPGGEARRRDDLPVRPDRGQGPEPAFFTIAVAPLRHADGALAGGQLTAIETTPAVEARIALRASEERYRLAVEAFQGGVSEYDVRADRTYGSDTFYRLFGDEPETGGQNLQDFFDRVHPDDREALAGGLAALIASDTAPRETEYRALHAEGRWIDLWTRAVVLRDERGRSTRIISTTVDITDRKRAEAALSASEERLRLATEGTGMGTWDFDLRTRAGLWSERAFRILGYEPRPDGAWTFREWAERVHPDDLTLARAAVADARDGRTSYRSEYRIRRADDGRERWVQSFGRYVDDASGEPVRFVGVFFDITERKLIEERLRASEERLVAIFAQAPVGLSVVGLDGRFLRVNGELCRILGRTEGELLRLAIPDVVHRDDVEPSLKVVEAALTTGRTASLDKRYRRPDGALVWANSSATRLHDARGRPGNLLVVTVDLTARREAEEALRASEQRFRTLTEGIPQLVWRATNDGEWTWASPQWCEYTGQRDPDSHGWDWLAPVHPDDRGAAREAWAGATTSGSFEVEYRIQRAADGRYRWFRTRAAPVRRRRGEIVEWLGTSTDVDDLRRLQEHQRLLLAELQHRVRNSLAVVRSIARRTAAASETVAEFDAHLDGRLSAFARAQAAVTRDPAAGVDLRSIVADELAAHAARAGDEVRLDGPEVRLRPKAAEALALAAHELATNAIKHGALAGERGGIDVSWRADTSDGEPRLVIIWEERLRGRRLSPPTRRGVGTELLEHTLGYELEAEVALDFRPTGLRCTIVVPFAEVEMRSEHA